VHALGEAVIAAAWVRAGTHVTSVGYERSRLFVESRLAFEPVPTGCYELQGVDPATGTELGEVLSGCRPGRVASEEITLYKAMGHAIEDVVAAELALRMAVHERDGLSVRL
jgi:ornithine cyclodeaminase/alanine dehydrogenase-like protein (mu-crystallin family)